MMTIDSPTFYSKSLANICLLEQEESSYPKECKEQWEDDEKCFNSQNFFKTSHDPKIVKTEFRSNGLILGSFESQGDGPHGKW